MSLQIPCPHCGNRPLEEFSHGELPETPDSLTDPNELDLDRGFMHTNTCGPTVERWFHALGCRRWLTLTRDTRTDTLSAGESERF